MPIKQAFIRHVANGCYIFAHLVLIESCEIGIILKLTLLYLRI